MEDFDVLSLARRSARTSDTIWLWDAIIEEVYIDNKAGYITVSTDTGSEPDTASLIVLIVSRNTIIQDLCGLTLTLGDLKKGMTIDAEISQAMTRSIPPQSAAIGIYVKNECFNTTVDRILGIDTEHNFLYTGNVNIISSIMRFVITDTTQILNRRGNRITLQNLRPGQTVKVEHATFQTMSIPPQTTAFRVQLL